MGTTAAEDYLSRIMVSPEEAAAMLKPGMGAFIGSVAGTPVSIVRALEARVPPPPDTTLYHFLTTGAYDGPDALKTTKYYHKVFFVGTDMNGFVAGGNADYVPIRLSEVPRLLETRRVPIDIAYVQVSPPDAQGNVSLGLSVDITMAVTRHARAIVAEINPNMPRTHGETSLHVSRLAAAVEVNTPLPTFGHEIEDELARRIARYVAGVIDDGSTLQIGLGRIPSETMRYLETRKNLGIHTDVVTDGIGVLVRSGAVTGAAKTVRPGKVVTSYCVGSEDLYRMVDDNPLFEFLPIETVCDPATIAANHKMVSITQAFGMDLTGQASIDQFDGQFYGGVSTQPDFMRGASRANEGKPIICMTSTTNDGKASRIRATLTGDDGVGIPRSDVHYVITEFGIAYLFGRSVQERALALIEIAHPDFREELLSQAKELGYVSKGQRAVRAGEYAIEEERRVALHDGREVLIRPARASDARSLQALFHRLPPEDIYTRFFRRLKFLSLEDAQMLCNVDHKADVAFVAVTGTREGEVVIGSGCYFLNEASNIAETGFIVDPNWQGSGLGRALQERMREHAVARGIRGFVAEVLPGNTRMLRLAERAGPNVSITRDEDSVSILSLFAEDPPQES